MMGTSWDPELYLRFDDHRARPFFDLLARIGATAPRRVVDLGCGPGQLTTVLSRRWPAATVEALDSSPEMVEAARGRGVAAELGDVRQWLPAADTDVVVTNAVLQWVPGHTALLHRWLTALPAGAWFGMQVPGNHRSPSHTLARELTEEPRWRGAVALGEEDPVAEPVEYAQLFAGAGAEVDVWETTYTHRLTGADPVLAWICATVLRPVRDALDDAGWAAFRAELAPRLRTAYPMQADGTTWFPFRRIFAVARRG
ncbi:trans-aconitate 2-methyltransferase [Pseudonocardia hispaniensis]|uniref:Trans-aconitate 2-methyltransferase n=1 Tax=Pseudonocardia hispaniensis TaxID=904933 RepID=A0ABW1J8M8_9PSEU